MLRNEYDANREMIMARRLAAERARRQPVVYGPKIVAKARRDRWDTILHLGLVAIAVSFVVAAIWASA
jgi:hypothetical protein